MMRMYDVREEGHRRKLGRHVDDKRPGAQMALALLRRRPISLLTLSLLTLLDSTFPGYPLWI